MRRVTCADSLRGLRSLGPSCAGRGASALALAALLLGAGCSKDKKPDPIEAAPAETAALTAEPPAHSGFARHHPPVAPAPDQGGGPSDVTYTAPASWKQVENPTPMRKATFKIPHAAGDPEDAELTVSQATGGVEGNAQRWQRQFSQGAEIKRTEKKVGELKVTVLEVHGTYNGSGMPGATAPTPKDKFMLLGAIVETSPLTFFKLTGPDKTLIAAKPDFDKFIDSLKAK